LVEETVLFGERRTQWKMGITTDFPQTSIYRDRIFSSTLNHHTKNAKHLAPLCFNDSHCFLGRSYHHIINQMIVFGMQQ